MLRHLSVRDIVLIDRLDLDFPAGLCALTGETGAGKSILLDALGLALGGRGGGDLVRAGAPRGSVSAQFDLADDHPAIQWLEENGYDPSDDGLLTLRRVVNADGKGRAYINDLACGVGALKALGGFLVEIQGQFDDRGLLNPAGHRGLLDAYGGFEGAVAGLRALHRALNEAEAARDAGHAELETARQDADYLKHALEELTALNPQPGEEDALDAERRMMQQAERVAEEVARAADLLGVQGAEGAMGDALRRLDHAATRVEGRLDAALAALDRAMTELGEASREIEAAMEALAFDPHRLERTEERLFALRALARKHQIGVGELPALRARMDERLGFIAAGEARVAALDKAAADALSAYLQAARALSDERRAAAKRLDAEVAEELAPLKMERAVFLTRVEPNEAARGAEGFDRVAFEVATNVGSRPGPIDKIASGGELSRFLLALKVRLAQRNEGLTLIFDEIDRGVGGATADAIGRRLQRLGAMGQTLVVTHSPQVAARAGAQWRITKSLADTEQGAATRTQVRPLNPEERLDEIARMLAGEEVTAAARAAAQSLLAAAAD